MKEPSFDKLTDCIVQAEAIGQALESACGENTLPWVFVYRQQIETIRAAADELECQFRGVAS